MLADKDGSHEAAADTPAPADAAAPPPPATMDPDKFLKMADADVHLYPSLFVEPPVVQPHVLKISSTYQGTSLPLIPESRR